MRRLGWWPVCHYHEPRPGHNCLECSNVVSLGWAGLGWAGPHQHLPTLFTPFTLLNGKDKIVLFYLDARLKRLLNLSLKCVAILETLGIVL